MKKKTAKKDNVYEQPKMQVEPHPDQQDRSKTGPTDELSMSLRATWTSFDPCSQLIKLERREKK